MQPVSVTTSGISVSAPVITDYLVPTFAVGFGVVVNGAATYTVQHTFDNPFAATFSPATANWFSNSTLVNQTTSQSGSYAFPVRAIRVSQTAGAGSTVATFVQSGSA